MQLGHSHVEKPCKDNFFFLLIHRAMIILRFIKNLPTKKLLVYPYIIRF